MHEHFIYKLAATSYFYVFPNLNPDYLLGAKYATHRLIPLH